MTQSQKIALLIPKPILKWAGGKTQLLPELLNKVPRRYGKYIEPFVGGGAVFFAMQSQKSVIADANHELVNLYRQIAENVDEVIAELSIYKNSERDFYKVRKIKFEDLTSAAAAARTIYLNRTCYNGLYRVNKQNEFNTPFGRYKNPNICNAEALRVASYRLKRTEIVCGDYKTVLAKYAEPGDFIFLDPPYLPVSEYSDFKRYTKEQFYEEDHRDLAVEVERLQELGCHVVLTNSNHPLVHELYAKYKIEIINTRRNISSHSRTRIGEDVIVTIVPRRRALLKSVPKPLPAQVNHYPPTRFMGSKEKLLPSIREVCDRFHFTSATDMFSGTGVVGYMFKSLGKAVVTNDYMAMNATSARAMIENKSVILSEDEIRGLFAPNEKADTYVSDTFRDLYFSDHDNRQIDLVRANIKQIRNKYKRSIAMSALVRACIKKRPRGIFTYTGFRYDDGRADLRTSLTDHIIDAARKINRAVFDNGQENIARFGDAMSLSPKTDLVYIDPPYFSPLSDNEYVRRYHFVEGLARDWRGVDMQPHTKTHKFKSYPTPFSSRDGAYDAFDKLFAHCKSSIILVSYSSNSLPTREEIVSLISKYKEHVEVIDVDHRYSFANQGGNTDIKNKVKEYLFLGY